MKKYWIFLILVSFFFIFSKEVYAQEFIIDGKTYNIDTERTPYFFALTNYDNYYIGNDKIMTTNCTENLDEQFCNFYSGDEMIVGLNIQKKYFFTNHDIRNKDTNEVVFKKNVEASYDQTLGYDWPKDWDGTTENIYFDSPKNIKNNQEIKSYFESHDMTIDQAENLLNYTVERQKNINKCNYYIITYGSSYAYGYDYGFWLNCFEKESDVDKYFTLKSQHFNDGGTNGHEDFIINIYNVVDSSIENLENAYFYYYSGENISERIRSHKEASTFNRINSLTIDEIENDQDDDIGLKNNLLISGTYSNFTNYRYNVPADSDGNWNYYKYFYYGNLKIMNGDIIVFHEPEPYITYKIIETDGNGSNVELTYHYMNENYYTNYYNHTFGSFYDINLNGSDKFTIEKLNLDTIITVYIYDIKTDEQVYSIVIDLNNIQLDLKNDPYILIQGYNQDNVPNSVKYKYMNTTKEMKCYWQLGGQERHEEDCSGGTMWKLKNADYNTYLILSIEKDNEVIYKKTTNLNFLENMPQIKFNSYYDSVDSSQKLDVTLNYVDTSTDTFFYSYNDKEYIQFYETSMTLIFYNNTDFYAKIKRNNEDVAFAYIYVVYNSYSNGNPTGTGQVNSIKNILNYFDGFNSFIKSAQVLFNKTWNSLKSSPIIIYILLLVTGTFIVMIIKAMNRR